MLCENLAKSHDVTAISFKRMFPKIFYPGKDQYEPNPKEKVFPFKHLILIDTLNPITWIQTARLIQKEKPDRLIFQWWHWFFSPCYASIALLVKLLGQTKNSKIAVISHHFLPPNSNALINSVLFRCLAWLVDYYITFSLNVKKEIEKHLPIKKVFHVIEPSYGSAIENNDKISSEKSRKYLGINGNILIFFGFVRPYKGLNHLILALPYVLKKINVTLIIAGEFWQDKKKYLDKIKKLGLEKNIVIHDQYIPPNMVQHYFKSADAIVMPYETCTNSAILKIAFKFTTPIIATKVGCIAELIEDNKTGILVNPNNPEALSQAIINFFEHNYKIKLQEGMLKSKDMFKWSEEKERIILNTT